MEIKELVSVTNAYMSKKGGDQSGAAANRGVLKNVALYITEIFDVLGMIPTSEQIGFPSSSAAGQVTNVSKTSIDF